MAQIRACLVVRHLHIRTWTVRQTWRQPVPTCGKGFQFAVECLFLVRWLEGMSEAHLRAPWAHWDRALTCVSADRRPSSASVLWSSRRYFARQSASSSRFDSAIHACAQDMQLVSIPMDKMAAPSVVRTPVRADEPLVHHVGTRPANAARQKSTFSQITQGKQSVPRDPQDPPVLPPCTGTAPGLPRRPSTRRR